MGQLIPIYIQECVPGDFFTISADTLVRLQPLVAPVMHTVDVVTEYFYVPYRLLWKDWETFITRGKTGEETPSIPRYSPRDNKDFYKFSLWDYFGFPIQPEGTDYLAYADGVLPVRFPWLAYTLVWDQYYRDLDLQATALDEYGYLAFSFYYPVNCAWEKDYFTVSRPWQQRGTPPSIPITGVAPVALYDNFLIPDELQTQGAMTLSVVDTSPPPGGLRALKDPIVTFLEGKQPQPNTGYFVGADMSTASTFTPADLRLAFQIQRWQELNARAGVRYTEFLRSHFDEAPADERLQRPEYIGGVRHSVLFSEVLQTSQTSEQSPQGNLAGHGITADSSYVGKYRSQEFGMIIGLLRIVPKTMYQQGINRQWLRFSSWDYYFPEFAHLSEQPVQTAELFVTKDLTVNTSVFGYQERFGEMRINYNTVAGDMRDKLDYWHLGRKFDNVPLLNEDFITCVPSKRIFAVQDEPGFIVTHTNRVTAVRPLPRMGEPGLIDHA